MCDLICDVIIRCV